MLLGSVVTNTETYKVKILRLDLKKLCGIDGSSKNGHHLEPLEKIETGLSYFWLYQPAWCRMSVKSPSSFYVIQ